jgi:hypothetical protein
MDKELDAAMFAVNEKTKAASIEMNKYIDNLSEYGIKQYFFNKGQFQAYSEIYTMLNNISERLKQN